MDVKIRTLSGIHDRNGAELQMIDSHHLDSFGELFFIYVKPNRVRAWDRFSADLHVCVPSGTAQFVLYDQEADMSRTLILGLSGLYSIVTIPAGVWFGFKSAVESRGALAAIISEKRLDEIEHVSMRFDSLTNRAGRVVSDWR